MFPSVVKEMSTRDVDIALKEFDVLECLFHICVTKQAVVPSDN